MLVKLIKICLKSLKENVCLMNFLFRMVWKKEVLYCRDHYAIRKMQEQQRSGTECVQIYTGDINLCVKI
jgi:hypothetical protein